MAMPAPIDPRTLGPGLTAAVLDQLPDDGHRYEMVRGELLVSPAPDNRHQAISMALTEAFLPYLRRVGTAVLRAAPLNCEGGPDTRVQPDLVALPTHLGAQVAPYRLEQLLLVIEILSPSTAHVDRAAKHRLYQDAGIPTCWLVDPADGIVEVWTPTAAFPDVARERVTWSAPDAAEPLVVDVAALFAPI